VEGWIIYFGFSVSDEAGGSRRGLFRDGRRRPAPKTDAIQGRYK
jgi:hypothetical protein